jgi:hypothetical protein
MLPEPYDDVTADVTAATKHGMCAWWMDGWVGLLPHLVHVIRDTHQLPQLRHVPHDVLQEHTKCSTP